MRGKAEIRHDCKMWALVAEMWALKMEAEAMRTENAERALLEASPAYGEEAFTQLVRGFQELANQLREL